MDGATQKLNELFAPVMKALGVTDVWLVVACIATFLFLLFFILFVSRIVKVSRLKKLITEKDDQITGLTAMANLQPLGGADSGYVESVVYQSTSFKPACDAQQGSGGQETAPGLEKTRLATEADFAEVQSSSFDDAWRSENTDFVNRYETGTVFPAEAEQSKRHLTDVIFGGGSGSEDAPAEVEDAASQNAGGDVAAHSGEQSMPEPLGAQENPRLDHIRNMNLEQEEESVLFPESDSPEGKVRPEGHDHMLSGRIPRL